MYNRVRWGTTSFGFVAEPPNAQWTKQMIRGFAKAGYEQAVAIDGTTIVAALWIRRHRV